MPAPDDTLYDIVFTGDCAPGHDPEAMRRAVQVLFRLDDARALKLFRAGRVVVKHAVDLATARRFEAAFSEVGAVVEITPAEVEETIVATAAVEPEPRPAPRAPVAADGWPAPAPAEDIERALLAPTDVPPAADQTRAPAISFDHLQLAPVGAPLDELDDRVPIPFPDISHLALVLDPDWTLLDCAEPVRPPPLPAIDHLGLEPITPPRPRGGDGFD